MSQQEPVPAKEKNKKEKKGRDQAEIPEPGPPSRPHLPSQRLIG